MFGFPVGKGATMSYPMRATRPSRGRTCCLCLLALVHLSCRAELPPDFSTLTLEKKIEAYKQYFDNQWGILPPLGTPKAEFYARAHISLHGIEAANAMVPFITGERKGIPRSAAIEIIQFVQARGCLLKGTAAESALEWLLKSGNPTPHEIIIATSALDVIKNNLFFPNGPDLLGRGPCGPPSVGGQTQRSEVSDGRR